jgi:hypothetical protein
MASMPSFCAGKALPSRCVAARTIKTPALTFQAIEEGDGPLVLRLHGLLLPPSWFELRLRPGSDLADGRSESAGRGNGRAAQARN